VAIEMTFKTLFTILRAWRSILKSCTRNGRHNLAQVRVLAQFEHNEPTTFKPGEISYIWQVDKTPRSRLR
jgi:hypothetical protein